MPHLAKYCRQVILPSQAAMKSARCASHISLGRFGAKIGRTISLAASRSAATVAVHLRSVPLWLIVGCIAVHSLGTLQMRDANPQTSLRDAANMRRSDLRENLRSRARDAAISDWPHAALTGPGCGLHPEPRAAGRVLGRRVRTNAPGGRTPARAGAPSAAVAPLSFRPSRKLPVGERRACGMNSVASFRLSRCDPTGDRGLRSG